MKNIPIVIALLLVSTSSFADVYYAVNKRGEVVAKSKAPFTNVSSLELREEKQITATLDLDIDEAVVESGQIKKRDKTQAEKNIEKHEKGLSDEEKLIGSRMRKLAIDSLKADGIKFKYIEEGV